MLVSYEMGDSKARELSHFLAETIRMRGEQEQTNLLMGAMQEIPGEGGHEHTVFHGDMDD
jgi:hypothetical protein